MDKNLKLILGLIWTLILHYQISIGFGIDDDSDKDGPTPKQALMAYLQVDILFNHSCFWAPLASLDTCFQVLLAGKCCKQPVQCMIMVMSNLVGVGMTVYSLGYYSFPL